MEQKLLALMGIILFVLLVWAAANDGKPKDTYQDQQVLLKELGLRPHPSMLETMIRNDPTNFNKFPKE
jgi:hypothetical protein